MKNYTITDQYILGQVACLRGYPAKQNSSESFIRGFAAQYEQEQRDYASSIAPGLLLYPSKTECLEEE